MGREGRRKIRIRTLGGRVSSVCAGCKTAWGADVREFVRDEKLPLREVRVLCAMSDTPLRDVRVLVRDVRHPVTRCPGA